MSLELFISIILVCILELAQSYWVYGIGCFLLITISFLIALSFEILKNKEKNSWKIMVQKIIRFCNKMAGLILLIVIITSVFRIEQVRVVSSANADVNANNLIYYTFYFFVMVAMLLFINYFATNSNSIRQCVIAIMESLSEFFKENFLVSFLIVLGCVYLQQFNKELFIALIGGWLFYFFDGFNKHYQKNKRKYRCTKFSKSDIIIQVIINIIILFIIGDFERLLNFVTFKDSGINIVYLQKILIHLFSLALITSVAYYKTEILNSRVGGVIIKKIKELN